MLGFQRMQRTCARQQRGAASLLVVVVLFFILALVTAYASRNLIFEQRISANNLRATQAFEAAEAGIEFSIAALGGGRVAGNCTDTTNTANDTFRQRYLQNVDGTFGMSGPQAALRPTCMVLSTGTECSCPTAGNAPVLADQVGPVPTFQMRFDTAGIAQPGVVRVYSRGCSNVGAPCYGATPADAQAEVSVLLGLNSALATPPSAALTVRGAVDLGGGAVGVSNADVPTAGITINAGGDVTNAGNARLLGVAGTPGPDSMVANDPSLNELDGNRMFVTVFGMDKATYRSQPAAVRVACTGACGQLIADTVSANPGRVIWVDGDATIESNQVIGSPTDPVLLLVRGHLTVAANLQMHGVLYLHANGGTSWSTTAGSTTINGAVVAEDGLTFVGAPTISFDPAVLRIINLTQGSLVRIPGSWRDFAAGS